MTDCNITQNNSIDIFFGKWKLHKMHNFNNFLKFIKLNVFITKLIKKIPVSLLIKDYNDGSYQKKISSPFYSVDEKILLDNEYRDYDQFTKKYKMENDMIICQAKINKYKIKWKEVIYLKKDILYVDFMWTDKKGENQFARHIFKK